MSGCLSPPVPDENVAPVPTVATKTAAVTTIPTAPKPPTATAAPLHSPLYLPGFSVGQVTEYFEEVVLQMEYTDGIGDVTLVQKWTTPLCYRIEGNPTAEDAAVLTTFTADLNAVEGFPGMYEAAEGETENLTIRFLDQTAFYDAFYTVVGDEDAYGATWFYYYTDTNNIYTATIGCRTDMDQSERNSVLIEEIVNTLGFTDTVLREDSIVYQYSDDNTTLSDIDWLLLRLLYHPQMQCGMDAKACGDVIRELYY